MIRSWYLPVGLAVMTSLSGGCLDEQALDGQYGLDLGLVSPDLARSTAPVVQILAPKDKAVYKLETISFAGSASDNDGNKLTGASLQWSSSLDGPIGTGTDFTRTLSPGAHRITLLASDAKGRRASVEITLSVSIL